MVFHSTVLEGPHLVVHHPVSEPDLAHLEFTATEIDDVAALMAARARRKMCSMFPLRGSPAGFKNDGRTWRV